MKWYHAGLALALATTPFALPHVARAQVFVGIAVPVAPPPLLVYAQPPIPGPDYIWTPGYWGWDQDAADYYWIPGTWAVAPQPGYLWTPGYWGWNEGQYIFHAGYWGPHVGFYGGVPYGYGYTGDGYQGGYWQGPHFFYNQAVNNFGGTHITNVYERNVTMNQRHISYNGGPGGIGARPTQGDMSYDHESHIAATPMQMQHFQAARQDHGNDHGANHGTPATADRPGMAPRLAPEQRQMQQGGGQRPAPAVQQQNRAPMEDRPAQHAPMQQQQRPEARAQPGGEHPPAQHEERPQASHDGGDHRN